MKKLVLISFLCILLLINAMEDKDNKELINTAFREAVEKAILNPTQKTFPEIEKYLNQGADINSKIGSLKETPIIGAVKTFNKTLFDFLLQKGADINSQDALGATPIYIALTKYQLAREAHFDLEEDFLKRGANPNIKKNDDTLLYVAIQLNIIESINPLIKHCANINEKYAFEWTSLYCAIQDCKVEIIKKLCNLGASLTNIDINDSNVFHEAIDNQFSKEHINFFITNSRFDSYNKDIDEQLKNSVKTTLLAFNRLNLKFPKEIPLIIFSYLALNSLHSFNKKLCQQLINNKNAKNPLLTYTYNHVDNLEQILKNKNKQGKTALQLLHDDYKNDHPYIQEVEPLVDGTKLQQDRITFMNGLAKEDNLVAQIYEQSKKLLLEK